MHKEGASWERSEQSGQCYRGIRCTVAACNQSQYHGQATRCLEETGSQEVMERSSVFASKNTENQAIQQSDTPKKFQNCIKHGAFQSSAGLPIGNKQRASPMASAGSVGSARTLQSTIEQRKKLKWSKLQQTNAKNALLLARACNTYSKCLARDSQWESHQQAMIHPTLAHHRWSTMVAIWRNLPQRSSLEISRLRIEDRAVRARYAHKLLANTVHCSTRRTHFVTQAAAR